MKIKVILLFLTICHIKANTVECIFNDAKKIPKKMLSGYVIPYLKNKSLYIYWLGNWRKEIRASNPKAGASERVYLLFLEAVNNADKLVCQEALGRSSEKIYFIMLRKLFRRIDVKLKENDSELRLLLDKIQTFVST